MNKDISIMIELQHYWDMVSKANYDIERSKNSIRFWENKINQARDKISTLESEIMKMKNSIKQKEIELSQKDDHSKKLEARKSQMKTGKEIIALESEIKTIDLERGSLEENLINEMDDLSRMEKELVNLKSESSDMTAQFEKDTVLINEQITKHKAIAADNMARYEKLFTELEPVYKSKFTKLVGSKEGKAIASLEGENCGICHFKIPTHIVLDASKNDKILNCTNCGKFIYTR